MAAGPRKKVIFQIGLQCSGKTTAAEALLAEDDAAGTVIISLDDMPGMYARRLRANGYLLPGDNKANEIFGLGPIELVAVVKNAIAEEARRGPSYQEVLDLIYGLTRELLDYDYVPADQEEEVRIGFVYFVLGTIYGLPVPVADDGAMWAGHGAQRHCGVLLQYNPSKQPIWNKIKQMRAAFYEALGDPAVKRIIVSNCHAELSTFKTQALDAKASRAEVEFCVMPEVPLREIARRNYSRMWTTGKYVPWQTISETHKKLGKMVPTGLSKGWIEMLGGVSPPDEDGTRVVNVKVAFIRRSTPKRYQNLKEWCEDPTNVYVGRRGVVFVPDGDGGKIRYPPQASKFANPFRMSNGRGREAVIRKYREWLADQMNSGEITRDDLEELRGKTLGCWCAPAQCHGDVLVEMLLHADT